MNATTAKNNFFKVMDEAITTHEPICVTGKNGNVVIISEGRLESDSRNLIFICYTRNERKNTKGA